MRFSGEYFHTVDAKGRVSLPAKFRKGLDDDVMIVPGFENALYVFSEDAFDAWVDSLFTEDGTGYNPRSKKDVKFRKTLYASAESVTVDSAGRVKLSAKHIAKAQIDKDVAIIGDDDHIEIWDKDAWMAYLGSSSSFDEFMED